MTQYEKFREDLFSRIEKKRKRLIFQTGLTC